MCCCNDFARVVMKKRTTKRRKGCLYIRTETIKRRDRRPCRGSLERDGRRVCVHTVTRRAARDGGRKMHAQSRAKKQRDVQERENWRASLRVAWRECGGLQSARVKKRGKGKTHNERTGELVHHTHGEMDGLQQQMLPLGRRTQILIAENSS